MLKIFGRNLALPLVCSILITLRRQVGLAFIGHFSPSQNTGRVLQRNSSTPSGGWTLHQLRLRWGWWTKRSKPRGRDSRARLASIGVSEARPLLKMLDMELGTGIFIK